MNITGKRIRELRLQHNLTLDDVARHLNVGRQAIYKYEQGTVTNIPLENLEKMAELFGTTPGYLAGWTEDHPDDPLHNPPEDEDIRIVSGMMYDLPPEQRQQLIAMVRAYVEHNIINRKDNNNYQHT